MRNTTRSSLEYARNMVLIYLGILVGCVVLLGLAHWFFSDVRIGRVYWFHLDKERNLPTWFSGFVFFLFGCSAFVAYYWEQSINKTKETFYLPVLWVGVGLVGFYLSLDEITILHENIFWKETRQTTAELGETWKFFTQWQLLFAPAIVALFVYLVLFFSNRYRTSKGARISAFAGIACWVVALSLEGFRGTFKFLGANWYEFSMILEEMLETLGAICLLGAITFYILALVYHPPGESNRLLKPSALFISKKMVLVLIIVAGTMLVLGGGIYLSSSQQVKSNVPTPYLYKKAMKPITKQ